MRYAIRRTQKQVEQLRKRSQHFEKLSYRDLQALATKRGINARQSAEALRKALA